MKFTLYFRECHDLSKQPPVCIALLPYSDKYTTLESCMSQRNPCCFFALLLTAFFSLSYELRENESYNCVGSLCK